MRWVFWLLLLLNIGLFAWQQRLPQPVSSELALTPSVEVGASSQSLMLLAESRDKAAQGAATAAQQEADGRCVVLGGFDSVERARELEQRLLSLDIAARVISLESAAGSDHWVYIPPLASRQASLRQLRELQARRIDSYLITEGELANGILLGVFPRLDSAAAVAEKLRAAGYEPQVRELPRIYQSYWVRVAKQGQRLVDEQLQERLKGDFPDLKHELISCTGVAHIQ